MLMPFVKTNAFDYRSRLVVSGDRRASSRVFVCGNLLNLFAFQQPIAAPMCARLLSDDAEAERARVMRVYERMRKFALARISKFRLQRI